MSILPLICIGPKTGAPSFSKDMVRQWNFYAALIHSLLCEIQGRDETASMGNVLMPRERNDFNIKTAKWQMLIIIFLKIIRILYLLIMFAFCFRDQVFAKMLEMLSSLPAAKLLESNFEEVLDQERSEDYSAWNPDSQMCSVLGTCSMMLCPGPGVTGNFVNLYQKKDKMCSFKCITSLIEIYKRH